MALIHTRPKDDDGDDDVEQRPPRTAKERYRDLCTEDGKGNGEEHALRITVPSIYTCAFMLSIHRECREKWATKRRRKKHTRTQTVTHK